MLFIIIIIIIITIIIIIIILCVDKDRSIDRYRSIRTELPEPKLSLLENLRIKMHAMYYS